MTSHAHHAVALLIPVEADPERWVLKDDEEMPETALHDKVTELLRLVLEQWVKRSGRDAYVGSNIALRWNAARPAIGVDPDLYVVQPPPPGAERDAIDSLCTWKPGCSPPKLAIEVVSKANPNKDYSESPDKYAAAGVQELWVFDPERAGPRSAGGPQLLQVWQRNGRGQFVRVYRGDGPARSAWLDAWIVVTDSGRRLRVADDEAGTMLWLTGEETERAAREKLEAELAALKQQLARQSTPKRRAPRRG